MANRRLAVLLFAIALGLAATAAAGTLAVSPAALSLKGAAGRSATQTFHVSNNTDAGITINIDVADVLVQNGKRVFLPVERNAGDIAVLVNVSIRQVKLQPGERAEIPVTFVMPARARNRAVAVFFRAVRTEPIPNQPKIQYNIGAVVDFTISNEIALQPAGERVEPQSSTANAAISEEFENIGAEPVIARGVAAILSAPGKLVGKAAFQQIRFLPGERNRMRAEFPGTLPPGKYRVLSTIEYADQVMTRAAELVVP